MLSTFCILIYIIISLLFSFMFFVYIFTYIGNTNTNYKKIIKVNKSIFDDTPIGES